MTRLIRPVRQFGLTLVVMALMACHARDKQELRSFASSLQGAAEENRKSGSSGILTLDVKAWESAIVLLPPKASARGFQLPGHVIQALDQAANVSENSRLFLVRGERITAQEELDPTIQASPGYAHSQKINFKMGRSGNANRPIQVTLFEQPE
jgi:hypothetical protein